MPKHTSSKLAKVKSLE
jgi:hypothetical protein